MSARPGNGRQRVRLFWLQSGGCGGCTLSLIGAEGPDLVTCFEAAGIEVAWHPSLSEMNGRAVIDAMERICRDEEPLDILCLEGSVMRGPNNTGRYHLLAGSGRPAMEWIDALARKARYVVAVGSCAAFGGVTAAGANEVEACGLAYDGRKPGGLLGPEFRSGAGLPVINVAGCPIHPGWLTETLHRIAAGRFTRDDLDEWERPLAYTMHLVHHGCAWNEFYEYRSSHRAAGR